jgi:hypothetical protein
MAAFQITASRVQAPHSVARLHDSMRRAWSSAGAVGTRRPAVPKWLPRCTLTATRCTRLGEKFRHGLQFVSRALAVASPPHLTARPRRHTRSSPLDTLRAHCRTSPTPHRSRRMPGTLGPGTPCSPLAAEPPLPFQLPERDRRARSEQAYGKVRGCTRAYAGSTNALAKSTLLEAGVLEGRMLIEENRWHAPLSLRSHPAPRRAPCRTVLRRAAVT